MFAIAAESLCLKWTDLECVSQRSARDGNNNEWERERAANALLLRCCGYVHTETRGACCI